MTSHQTGIREEWAAARQELLALEKEHTRLGDGLRGGGASCRGSGSRRTTASTPTTARARWRNSSMAAVSCSSITSCSA